MKEASPVKFYIARNIFFAVACLQALGAVLFWIRFENSIRNQYIVLCLATVSLLFFALHLLLGTRIKRVAVGKKKIAIKQGKHVKRYGHDEIRELEFIRFINLFRLKLKGKRQSIYFLPTRDSATIYGMFTRAEDVTLRKK